MGENTPSRDCEHGRLARTCVICDLENERHELTMMLRRERDARQAAERHADHWERMQANTFARWDAAERRASWWETAAADAAMDRRVLEARVAALEAWITDHGWHLPPAVLGVQSTPTEPEGS